MRLSWIGAALLLLAACSSVTAEGRQEPSAALARHPESGLAVVPLTITSGGAFGGKVNRFQVEVARTQAEQAKGLMFRTAMGPNEGMIFPKSTPSPASFWMKNTVMPLDLLFIGADGRIESIAANAVPYSLDPIRSRGPVVAVLELNGGRAAQLGIAPGDKVSWPLAPARAEP